MKKLLAFIILFGAINFTSIVHAATVLFPVGGGTGTSTAPTYGQLLVGNSSGTYTLTATSSLGITGSGSWATTSSDYWLTTKTTDNLTQGSTNLYWSNTLFDTRFITDLAATSSVKSITTLPSLSLPYTQLTGTPTIPTNNNQLTNGAGYITSFTETDPIFVASQAHNITSTDITHLSNLSGINTGDQTTITGNAGTATKLQTARAINGVNFDGSAAITITAASSTLLANSNTFSGLNSFTNTGTTTFSGGINVTGGCLAVGSTCIGVGGSGTVTSVDMSVPTGLSISGNPITTSGTLALSLTSGYIIPLSASTTDWNTAYINRITSASSPLSISSNAISIASAAADGSTKGAASFTAADFNASSGNISLDYSNGQKATGSVPGFLSSTDWTTFNGKAASGANSDITGLTGLTSTSTATKGFNISGGCYAIGGTCIGGSTGSSNSVWATSSSDTTAVTLNGGARAYIGTTTQATARFEINNQDASATNGGLRVISNGTSGADYEARFDSPNPDLEFVETDQTAPAGKFEIAVNSDKLQINGRNSADDSFEPIAMFSRYASGGALGIGTLFDTPSAVLTVVATSTLKAFDIQDSSTGQGDLFRVDSTGKVSIGSSTPYSAKLTVTQTGNNPILRLSAPASDFEDYITLEGTAAQAASTPAIKWTNTAGNLTTAQIASAPGSSYQNSFLSFSVANSSKTLTERMRIDKSGNLGIGTTTPGAMLAVAGSGLIQNDLTVSGTLITEIDKSFSYSTSTTWTGTTTIPLGPAMRAETWNTVKCFTDAGTAFVQFNDGTNNMNSFQASTTVGAVTLSTNNSFTSSEKRYVSIGTPASSPTKVACTVSLTN